MKYNILAICIGMAFCLNTSLMAQSGTNTEVTVKGYPTKEKVSRSLKEVQASIELPVSKEVALHIINNSRNLDIQTWSENKIKLVANVYVDQEYKSTTDLALLEEAGISLRNLSNRVELNSRGSMIVYGSASSYGARSGGFESGHLATTINGSQGGSATTISSFSHNSKKHFLILFVPESTSLDLKNQFSAVTLRNNFNDIKVNIINSTLDCQDIGTLEMDAKYSIVNAGNIKEAEIEYENGTFRANNIQELDIDSKSSTIEYEKGEKIYMRSQRDNYSIESIARFEGRKLFGDLRINELTTTFDLEGANADVKIRNIRPGVEKIQLENKYADIRLPVKNIQNYSVAFEGAYSMVFAPFEKNIVKQEASAALKPVIADNQKQKIAVSSETPRTQSLTGTLSVQNVYKAVPGLAITSGNNSSQWSRNDASTTRLGEIAPSKFSASVGNTKGKYTRFELNCNSCTIDFK